MKSLLGKTKECSYLLNYRETDSIFYHLEKSQLASKCILHHQNLSQRENLLRYFKGLLY